MLELHGMPKHTIVIFVDASAYVDEIQRRQTKVRSPNPRIKWNDLATRFLTRNNDLLLLRQVLAWRWTGPKLSETPIYATRMGCRKGSEAVRLSSQAITPIGMTSMMSASRGVLSAALTLSTATPM
jgi:hypothetical protein